MQVKMMLIAGGKKGKAGKLLVKPGQRVIKGDELIQVETAKGSRAIKAPDDGVIEQVHIGEGDELSSEQVLFDLTQADAPTDITVIPVKMSLIAGGKKGKAGKILVGSGETVAKGDELVTVETHKGTRSIRAPQGGQIRQIHFAEGDEIKSEQTLFDLSSTSSQSDTSTQPKSEIKSLKTELLIIGGGPGGYVAAIYAAKQGKQVVLAEAESLGGTCLNTGCIPTKAIVKSSEIYQEILGCDSFGITIDGTIKPDMAQVIDRKDAITQQLVQGIEGLMEENNITVLKGLAAFESPHEVIVSGEDRTRVTADHIIIATGSQVANPNIPGLDLPVVMDSNKALSFKELPKEITIVGGGVIGMEFAFIYNNFGAKVHVVEFLDRPLAMLEEEQSRFVIEMAREAGIELHLNSKVTRIDQSQDGKAVVTFETENRQLMLVSEQVLVAIGRSPRTKGLQLEKAQVELDQKKRGIAVDEHLQTNQSHIYAIGDVTDLIQLAHVASYQGLVAIDHILGKDTAADYSAVPNVIFTSPEVASVGQREDQAKAKGLNVSSRVIEYGANGKALTMNQASGYVKLIRNDDTKQIIGASIVGVDASTLITAIGMAITNHLSDEDIVRTIIAHPTTGELIHEAALDFGVGAIHQS